MQVEATVEELLLITQWPTRLFLILRMVSRPVRGFVSLLLLLCTAHTDANANANACRCKMLAGN